MWSVSDLSHARRGGFEGAEQFHVHVLWGRSPLPQVVPHALQKCSWTTKIEVTIARHAKLVERSHAKSARSIEVYTYVVRRTRPAVLDVVVAKRQFL
jgi:hypothetical protein